MDSRGHRSARERRGCHWHGGAHRIGLSMPVADPMILLSTTEVLPSRALPHRRKNANLGYREHWSGASPRPSANAAHHIGLKANNRCFFFYSHSLRSRCFRICPRGSDWTDKWYILRHVSPTHAHFSVERQHKRGSKAVADMVCVPSGVGVSHSSSAFGFCFCHFFIGGGDQFRLSLSN